MNEVKTAIKPYYQKKEITKDEYKEIVRKAVEKVSAPTDQSQGRQPHAHTHTQIVLLSQF